MAHKSSPENWGVFATVFPPSLYSSPKPTGVTWLWTLMLESSTRMRMEENRCWAAPAASVGSNSLTLTDFVVYCQEHCLRNLQAELCVYKVVPPPEGRWLSPTALDTKAARPNLFITHILLSLLPLLLLPPLCTPKPNNISSDPYHCHLPWPTTGTNCRYNYLH